MFIFKNIMLGIFIFLTSPYATAGNFCLYLLGIYFYSGVGACVMLMCDGIGGSDYIQLRIPIQNFQFARSSDASGLPYSESLIKDGVPKNTTTILIRYKYEKHWYQ